jgi:hypothetical protein
VKRVVAVVAVVAVAGIAAASVAVVRGAAATGPAQIRITSTQERSAYVDAGARGRGVGDLEISTSLLYNRRITRKSIGRAELMCTTTFSGVRNCRGTYLLPRGSIVVGGTLRYRELYQLAILGGTGLYDNARGTLTVTRTNRSPLREVVVFRLTG